MPNRTSSERRSGLLFLVGLAALGWFLILWSVANRSSPFVSLTMPLDATWEVNEVIAVWIMWAVMMGAMMLPSAIPMLMVYRRASARKCPRTAGSHHWFLGGYLACWTIFSAAAATAQWGFQQAGVLSHMLVLRDPVLAGGILIAAGLYQFAPLKSVCLNKCRTPIGFLLTDWRPGLAGAFRMGINHGKYCIGCCWSLMMVLFVGGVMSLSTIALLSSFVLIEKLAPKGEMIAKLGGAALILWGLSLTA